MPRKIRVGVIGLGIMGEQYTRIYSSHPFAEVTAVAGDSVARSLFDAAAGMLVEGAMAAARNSDWIAPLSAYLTREELPSIARCWWSE